MMKVSLWYGQKMIYMWRGFHLTKQSGRKYAINLKFSLKMLFCQNFSDDFIQGCPHVTLLEC